MSAEKSNLLGVVLSGGKSRRMGRGKADLLMPDGRTFLDLARHRLSMVCDAVCISTAEQVPLRTPEDCTVLLDPPSSCGPITGISVALQYARDHGFAACLFNPIDTPALEPVHLLRLIAAFDESVASSSDRIICASSDEDSDRLEPLIAIYPTAVLPIITDSIAQQRYGLQKLLRSNDTVTVHLPATACRNINTPSDLDLFENET